MIGMGPDQEYTPRRPVDLSFKPGAILDDDSIPLCESCHENDADCGCECCDDAPFCKACCALEGGCASPTCTTCKGAAA